MQLRTTKNLNMAKTRQSLVRTADKIFSIHVRRRGETFGHNHCYTCGRYLPFEELQAGHFIPRRFLMVRWHPLNVWPQCNSCNVEKSGSLTVYERKLKSQFSELAIEALWDLARSGDDLTEADIKEIIKKYKSA